jgi:probable rRNA maturation factor
LPSFLFRATSSKLMATTVIYKRRLRSLSKQALAAFVTRACRIAQLRGAVTVLVTDDREMRAMNARFRDHDHATDVLSFPPMISGNGSAGDIAISRDMAARNARALGHSAAEEVKILALHGILHLAGYDHECDRGEMAKKEFELRRRLALPTALIERTVIGRTSAVGPPAKQTRLKA